MKYKDYIEATEKIRRILQAHGDENTRKVWKGLHEYVIDGNALDDIFAIDYGDEADED
jgi:isocitrate dehydrogenase kinase/phosphatase